MPTYTPPISKEKIVQLAEIWPTLTIEAKQKMMKLILASEDYYKTHATTVYSPFEKQKSFHLAKNVGRAVFGGNQSGKTYSGTMEDAFHFTGDYPEWYPEDQRMPTPNVGRIMVKDFPKAVGEIIEPAIFKAIHHRYISSVKRNSQGYLTKLISHKGNRIDIVTHEMDTQSLEGWQGDWFHMDEPAPRDKFIACLRGIIRRSGRWWLTCTPLTEPWMYDEIFTNPKVFCVVVDIRDNPYLKEEDIQNFLDSLTEEEREAREHGKFMHLSGLVYPEFNAETHIKPSDTLIPADWPRRLVIDPHDRRPFAMAWCAVDPMNRLWFYREWPQVVSDGGWFHKMTTSRRSPRDYKQLIQEAEGGETIFRRIMDARFGKQPKMQIEGHDMSEQPNLFDIFDELGMTFEPSYWTTSLSTSDPGHQAVKERLRISMVTEEPSFFVLSNCQNLIYAFQHNVWKAESEVQGQFAKDFLDLARFACMDDPVYFSPPQSDMGRSKWATQNQKPVGTYGSEVIT